MGDQEQKTREARIRRLRERLAEVGFATDKRLIAVLKGILDLLADEL